MRVNIKHLLLIFFCLVLSSCSKEVTVDFDPTTLPKPKKNNISKNVDININKPENKSIIKDLTPFKDRGQILSKFNYGKQDPFSEGEDTLTSLLSDFKVTGFLNTEDNGYAFVSYLGKEGTINYESIGGENTNLLPKGAKVVEIDSKSMKLIINFANENFVFEL